MSLETYAFPQYAIECHLPFHLNRLTTVRFDLRQYIARTRQRVLLKSRQRQNHRKFENKCGAVQCLHYYFRRNRASKRPHNC
jgi:hypothetical protein